MSITSKKIECGTHLSRCEELYRQEIYSSLSHERIQRKYTEIAELFEREGRYNWNEVFFILLMRRLGDGQNSETFMQIALRLPLHILLRERSNPLKVEALLIATAGFIGNYSNEDYIAPLREEASYLLHKYNITPLDIKHWNFSRIRPYNHPVVRLSQVSRLVCAYNFIFDTMLECKTLEDIDSLFKVEATKHLLDTHPYLTRQGRHSLAIGAQKRTLLGINLVVPLQFAYGYYINDDEICSRAHELNQMLPAESNKYIRDWQSYGIIPMYAFETQALIQLTTCYCMRSRCNECIVGQRISFGTI